MHLACAKLRSSLRPGLFCGLCTDQPRAACRVCGCGAKTAGFAAQAPTWRGVQVLALGVSSALLGVWAAWEAAGIAPQGQATSLATACEPLRRSACLVGLALRCALLRVRGGRKEHRSAREAGNSARCAATTVSQLFPVVR